MRPLTLSSATSQFPVPIPARTTPRPRFGDNPPPEEAEDQPEVQDPGLLRMIVLYGTHKITGIWRARQQEFRHKRGQDEREAQARRIHAFDAFRPNGYYDDEGQLITYPRKVEILRQLTPLIDAGFDKNAMYTVLRPIVTHDHPAIRRDFVETLLCGLKNDQAKAFVLAHFIPSLKQDTLLENRQQTMEVIESLPPEPLPKHLYFLLGKPEEQSHLRYWAGEAFSHDPDPDIRRRAEAVMATSEAPPAGTGRKKKLLR